MTKSKHNHSRKPSNASNTHSRKPSNAYSTLPTHSTTHSSDSETSSPASSKKSSTPSIDISDIHSHLSTLEDELKISLSNVILQSLNKMRAQGQDGKGDKWEEGVDELMVSCRKEVDYHVHALADQLWEKREIAEEFGLSP
ncbi:hypothetical protein D6C98_02906 [Aureobasidium pullulans]|uniref:Uncharacterized protein n=1 Tax=Aureobasidium pullulans TaxID=5580 RepID=A0A4S9NNT9_AURPU|nr:hypothetical protein D6D24_01632 [Aureobasidium pullulans]THY58899.1 hypothetical protein D6C98_02906 [Aureobasidium pullulans]